MDFPYILFSAIFAYLCVGIYKRKLMLLGKRTGVIYFKGEKAISTSILLLIISSVYFIVYEIKDFDLATFSSSFIIGLPVAIILYSFISTYSRIIVPEKSEPKNSMRNLILYSIFCTIILSFLVFFAAAFGLIILPFDAFYLLAIPFVLMYIIAAVIFSAKQIYHKEYVYVGAVNQVDEEKIKTILGTNNIPHIIEPLFKDKTKNSNSHMMKVLVKEEIEDKALELLKDQIDTSPIIRWY